MAIFLCFQLSRSSCPFPTTSPWTSSPRRCRWTGLMAWWTPTGTCSSLAKTSPSTSSTSASWPWPTIVCCTGTNSIKTFCRSWLIHVMSRMKLNNWLFEMLQTHCLKASNRDSNSSHNYIVLPSFLAFDLLLCSIPLLGLKPRVTQFKMPLKHALDRSTIYQPMELFIRRLILAQLLFVVLCERSLLFWNL